MKDKTETIDNPHNLNETKLEHGKRDALESEEMTVLKCKKPVTLTIMNPRGFLDGFKNTYMKLSGLHLIFGGKWWDKREYRIDQSKLDDIEKFCVWLIKKHESLFGKTKWGEKSRSEKDDQIQWGLGERYVYELLYFINNINKNSKPDVDGMKKYVFKGTAHFAHFGYCGCQVMGLGYHFRKMEKEMNISFNRFKDLQLTCKTILEAGVQMECKNTQNLSDEKTRWLDN
jgi:hypothetical protein